MMAHLRIWDVISSGAVYGLGLMSLALALNSKSLTFALAFAKKPESLLRRDSSDSSLYVYEYYNISFVYTNYKLSRKVLMSIRNESI